MTVGEAEEGSQPSLAGVVVDDGGGSEGVTIWRRNKITPPHCLSQSQQDIVDHIDDQADRLRCSLVSHTWLAFCRKELKFTVSGAPDISTLVQLVARSSNTLASAISELRLKRAIIDPLLPHFGDFTRLSVLVLECCTLVDTPIPSLPSLTDLTLSAVAFNWYDVFGASMAGLPRLERLGLASIGCGPYRSPMHHPLPVFNLVQLKLGFHFATNVDERIVFSFRPQTLIVAQTWPFPIIEKYLRWLGPDLQTLQFSDVEPRYDICLLDFSVNVNLEHFLIDSALQVHVLRLQQGQPTIDRVTVTTIFLILLNNLAMQATGLRKISLQARQAEESSVWDQDIFALTVLLRTPPFVGLRQIRVVVGADERSEVPGLEAVLRQRPAFADELFVYVEE
ncbi:hypothetical protein FB45DRAFT_1126446 [Roridomyces roridus]|uniref:F-box domain-containing protein n=1 Tax=Roridomyces roridus TaxID=1738132 RepID=A0AAD7FW55_9AGAR|nr:hypothetical protein FB45DRAFT_1126446 [Roridomyces roridus]